MTGMGVPNLTVPSDNQTITSDGTTYECLLVPSEKEESKQTVKLTLTIDGIDKEATLSGENGVIIAQNTKSNIAITLSNSGISVQTVSVEDWNVVEIGGHKVTIALADGVATHDVLVDAYVDGNSVIVSAYSKSGQHLKCTMPDGEFCTSQSRTDKLVYDFNAASYTSPTAHISHFMWCMSMEESSKQTYAETGTGENDIIFSNQSSFMVIGFDEGECFTLSNAEWTCLLTERESSTVNGTANARYFTGCLQTEDGNAINGMFIFPDTFTWPASVETQPERINDFSTEGTNTYTYYELKRLQDTGIVFLPAAGYRIGNSSYPASEKVESAGSIGYYWSSTLISCDTPYYLSINPGEYSPFMRYFAFAVRLVNRVTEVK